MKALSHPSHRKGATLATLGGLLTAILASACCWLPLLLLGFGVTGVAVGSFFEEYRFLFAIVTFLALGTAWYLTYRSAPATSAVSGKEGATCDIKEETCGSCASDTVKPVKRFNKAMLWIATLLALAFVFFPNYIGAFLGTDGDVANESDVAAAASVYELSIEGMHCEACAATLTRSLSGIDGFSGVSVDYEGKKAIVRSSLNMGDVEMRARTAIEREGYKLIGVVNR